MIGEEVTGSTRSLFVRIPVFLFFVLEGGGGNSAWATALGAAGVRQESQWKRAKLRRSLQEERKSYKIYHSSLAKHGTIYLTRK